jgi:hypothetical protein
MSGMGQTLMAESCKHDQDIFGSGNAVNFFFFGPMKYLLVSREVPGSKQ